MIDGSGGLGGLGRFHTHLYHARSRGPGHEGRRRLGTAQRPFAEFVPGLTPATVFAGRMQENAA